MAVGVIHADRTAVYGGSGGGDGGGGEGGGDGGGFGGDAGGEGGGLWNSNRWPAPGYGDPIIFGPLRVSFLSTFMVFVKL